MQYLVGPWNLLRWKKYFANVLLVVILVTVCSAVHHYKDSFERKSTKERFQGPKAGVGEYTLPGRLWLDRPSIAPVFQS
jgi:hypothetical protein